MCDRHNVSASTLVLVNKYVSTGMWSVGDVGVVVGGKCLVGKTRLGETRGEAIHSYTPSSYLPWSKPQSARVGFQNKWKRPTQAGRDKTPNFIEPRVVLTTHRQEPQPTPTQKKGTDEGGDHTLTYEPSHTPGNLCDTEVQLLLGSSTTTTLTNIIPYETWRQPLIYDNVI